MPDVEFFEIYKDLNSLGDNNVFKDLYEDAAHRAASFYGYEPEISPDALRNAWRKFVADFGRFNVHNLKKPMKVIRVGSALLMRSAAAYQITTYKSIKFNANVVRYDRKFARDYCNELTALTFGISILSVELARHYKSKYNKEINIESLKLIKPFKIKSYVDILVEDRQSNFNSRNGHFRRDFYSLFEVINVYLLRDVR